MLSGRGGWHQSAFVVQRFASMQNIGWLVLTRGAVIAIFRDT